MLFRNVLFYITVSLGYIKFYYSYYSYSASGSVVLVSILLVPGSVKYVSVCVCVAHSE